jgi:hypothetical protein
LSTPTGLEVVEWLAQIEGDPERRRWLTTGLALTETASFTGLIERSDQAKQALARVLAELCQDEAIGFYYQERRGERLTPDEMTLDRLKECGGFKLRAKGRAMLATPTIHIENVEQLAGRDINNAFTIVVEEAESQLDTLDLPEHEREAARSRLQRFTRDIASAGGDAASKIAAEALLRLAGVR